MFRANTLVGERIFILVPSLEQIKYPSHLSFIRNQRFLSPVFPHYHIIKAWGSSFMRLNIVVACLINDFYENFLDFIPCLSNLHFGRRLFNELFYTLVMYMFLGKELAINGFQPWGLFLFLSEGNCWHSGVWCCNLLGAWRNARGMHAIETAFHMGWGCHNFWHWRQRDVEVFIIG